MIGIRAPVTARLEAMPGIWQIHLHAPQIARSARPGQFVMALRSPTYDPYLRVPLPLHKIGEETIAFLLDADDATYRELAQAPVGTELDLLGPFGRGFDILPRTQNLLLIAEEMGIASLVGLAERAVTEGKRVTLAALVGKRERLYPTELLPLAVEYHGLVIDAERDAVLRALLAETLPWADQLCAAGSDEFGRLLCAEIRSDPIRARSGSAQFGVSASIACGMGLCLACAVQTRRGMQRACSEGPVFDLADLC